MNETPAELGWVPDACTLPTAEQPLRVAEFDALFAASLRHADRRTPTRLRLTLGSSTEPADASPSDAGPANASPADASPADASPASAGPADTSPADTSPADVSLADAVRDLAARETQCCSFFTFTVATPEPGVVRLDVEVPSGHVDVLDALEARAAAVGSRA
ncbi:MAG: hypothetical protein HOV71_01100 [Hamadaea sp.]|nr:hypothetical protein [Hamadaea sp.]NUR46707.1 hypothetical protein [Hamadaea sp.]NUT08809.1 hypothetical protein [Hamadaea sp.]